MLENPIKNENLPLTPSYGSIILKIVLWAHFTNSHVVLSQSSDILKNPYFGTGYCSKPIWTSSWADHQQPALVHLPLTLCDRPLGPLLLPLLLHQATLEQGAVSNAAAVATEGQQRRHAPIQELQHTRFPWP